MLVSSGIPSVRVPVLSKANTVAFCRLCSAVPCRKNTPCSAAAPVPTMIDVGVANPMAQGHATIKTDTAATKATPSAGSVPKKNQPIKVAIAISSTIGTNTLLIRSTVV